MTTTITDDYVRLTDAAILAFKQKLSERKTPNACIRLGVKGSGCSGFTYVIQFEDDFPKDKDLQFIYNGLKVLVDKKSIKFLVGATLDYEKTLISQGFKFINEKEKSRCGCGLSFNI